MMKGSDIGIHELFNEWERFTSNEGESIESYNHRFLKLMNDLKRNKHFPKKIASNLKFLNNLQPEWSRHVIIVHQTKDLHTADYTQLYDFLKYNQKEVDELKAERLAKIQDPLALMANSINPYAFPASHQDQPSYNQNYMQQPMLNPEDITDPTTAMNMSLALIAKAFKLNYSTPTNNNHRISSNPHNRQIAQPGMKIGQDRQMQMDRGNGEKQFRQYAGQNVGNLNGYNTVQNVGNQNAVQNPRIQNIRNQNRLIGVPGNANQNLNGNGNLVAARADGNAAGHNGNQIRDATYLQTQLLIAQKEEAGIQLQVEEFDLVAIATDLDEIEEVNANCILMANLQQSSTSSTQTDKAPVYDSDGLAEINALHLSTGKQIMTLNKQILDLNKQLSKEKSTISFLLEEKKKLKSDFKTREDELLDKQIQLEKKIKELNNILVKTGQLIQTIHMLSPKPDSFYHTEEKMALGYKNPIYLKQAQKKQQSLYDGKVLHEKHDPPVVHDSEETLQLAQETKFVGDFKFLAKEVDESLVKHKTLELEIERLLRAVVNQDIMSILQKTSVVDTSNLQTELECTKQRFENCIIKKENEYTKLWNDWCKKCDECKYDKISYDKAYKVMQQKIKQLQAQLGDLKGKSKYTNPLSQKLENKNVSVQKDNTCGMSKNTKFAKQSILGKPPMLGEIHALSKLVTLNSIPTPQESKVVKNDKVIAPGMFRINPFKTSREEKHVPNNVRASAKTKPITVSQPPVITKKDVNSDSNSLSFIGIDNTKTRRPQPRINTKNDKVPSASKSNRSKNKGSEVEEHHRNLLLSKNTKHMSSACNNIKLNSQNVISKVVCTMCKQCLISVNHDVCLRNYVNGKTSRGKKQTANVSIKEKQKKRKPKVKKPKKVGFIERLATPKPRTPRFLLRWSPTGKLFDYKGKIVDSSESESQSDCSNGDNACTSNTLEPKFKRFPNSTSLLRRQFCDSDLEVAFRRNACFVKNLEGVDLLKGVRSTNLYTINLHEMASASPVRLMARASSTKSWLWHQRLSHLNFDTINDLAINDFVSGLLKFKYHKEHLCPSCEQGKSKKAFHPPKPVPNSRQRLHLLHMDLCGPMRIASINEKRYLLVIVDDYSRYTWVHFLKSKDEAPEVIKTFLKRITVLLQSPVIIIRTDNGTKFKNQAARTMLIFSRASLFLWAEAIATACFTQNRSIIHRRFNKMPYELINGRKPDISFLHIFGALCYPKNDREDIGKLGAKELDLTYTPSTITTQQPTESELDLLFEAMYDDYIVGQPSATARTVTASQEPQVRQTSTASTSIADTAPTPTNSSSLAKYIPISSQDVDELNPNAMIDGNMVFNPFANPSTSAAKSSSSQNVNPLNMHTFYQPYPHEFQWTKDHPLEQNVKEAMTDPAWIDSMQEDLLQFKSLNNVKETMTDPAWIDSMQEDLLQFKSLNHDEEQTVIQNKSRLVVRGYRQEEGIDFKESFASIVRMEAIRIFLAYAAHKSVSVFQMDVKIAFLYGSLKEDMYIFQPEGFIDDDHPSHGTVNTGLWYMKDSSFELTGFLDADYAGCIDFKSTSCGAQFLGEKLVSWSSKKQDCTTLSTVEAEYVSLFVCYAHVLWMRTQLTDYGFNFNKIPIYCDSKSAIAISCNPVQHSRTKHIAFRYHFIKEHVEKDTIELYFVKMDYQLADLFTKALPADRFNYLVRRLGMRSLSPQELDRLVKSQITRWDYSLIPTESKFKTLCSIIKDKYMMKAQYMLRGRLLASFQDLEHEGGDTRSQGGIILKDKDLEISVVRDQDLRLQACKWIFKRIPENTRLLVSRRLKKDSQLNDHPLRGDC
nr:retrovirus-related Pol polyprotein from transposon TNT 1-94 [Tanacetum cinerariifolium]